MAGMFVYLSKKIAIPNNVRLRCVSWNAEDSWIACGGEGGLLKARDDVTSPAGCRPSPLTSPPQVLKLEAPRSAPAADGAKGASALAMNQTLEGHGGAVMCACWNETYKKLTTSDQDGLIIVWMLHKGLWFEEMINNRNKSLVRDMRWSADGQKICIVYEDGAVIVGSVDGNRLWGKELPLQLAMVEWSPDGKFLLFCTTAGECHIHDATGNPLAKMPLAAAGPPGGPRDVIVGLHWYNGAEGYTDPAAPTLAIGFESGRVQLSRSEVDDLPVVLDTGLRATCMVWSPNGGLLAVCGGQVGPDGREGALVQFYANTGAHVRTLRIPGPSVASLSWEGGGLRVALAVDSFIYFANIRPDYKWAYFGKTLVYAFAKPERPDLCVTFWDTATGDKSAKYVTGLLAIRAAGDHAVLAAATGEPHEYSLTLCDAIGSPVALAYTDVEPVYVAMTATHVVAASETQAYVWAYTGVTGGGAGAGRPPGVKYTLDAKGGLSPAGSHRVVALSSASRGVELPDEAIAAIAVAPPAPGSPGGGGTLVLARWSGLLHRFALSSLATEGTEVLRCRPHILALNCGARRLACVDASGSLSFFDFESADGASPAETGAGPGAQLPLERKDVWAVLWSEDDPLLCAVMEKTRMYIFRDLQPEEPVTSSAYLCRFSELQIRTAALDEILRSPESPEKGPDKLPNVMDHEVKALRTLKSMLASHETGEGKLTDVVAFVEANSHPRLWRTVAEAALSSLELPVAERAYVRCGDYAGIQLVKRLGTLDDDAKRRAEVLAHARRFDESEAAYLKMDRADLALELRAALGDWFRVEQLLQSSGAGDDAQLAATRAKIGDHYADRGRLARAAQCYESSGLAAAVGRRVAALYALEDFAALDKMVDTLPEGSPHLTDLGAKFQSVGLCTEAVRAYLRAGGPAGVKAAVDACVLLHQWGAAVRLAEQHGMGQIEGLLEGYASRLLKEGRRLAAVELYRKAGRHAESARLLAGLAREAAAAKSHPVRAKKLAVLAALEQDKARRKAAEAESGAASTAAIRTAVASTLAGFMTSAATMGGRGAGGADGNLWRPAEALHFYLLAQRLLYAGDFERALLPALRLREYEDVLGAEDANALGALVAYYARWGGQCSRAFIKLEALAEVSPAKRTAYADLAMALFAAKKPVDPQHTRLACPEPDCGERVHAWSAKCPKTGTPFPFCVATGRALFGQEPRRRCRQCRHYVLESAVPAAAACPLCHAGNPYERPGGGAGGGSGRPVPGGPTLAASASFAPGGMAASAMMAGLMR